MIERLEAEQYGPPPSQVDDVDLADDLAKLVALVRKALGE